MMSSFLSSKMILNLGKMSRGPNKSGTSSINAQASLIGRVSPFMTRLAFLSIYGTPPPETPFISKISSLGNCLKPSALPSSSETMVISAPESIYIAASIFSRPASSRTSATGLKVVPVIWDDSFRYLNFIIILTLIFQGFLLRKEFLWDTFYVHFSA